MANPLQEYAATRDAQAFTALLEHYGPMVYATCRRMLGPAGAEDATQEVFFKLARQAATIRGNLGAWLHRCATHHCIGMLRADARRAQRDRVYEAAREKRRGEAGEASWAEVAPQLDEAIERLPDDVRHLLVEHYLHQRTQTQLAAEAGVSVATVSRRLEKALAALREQLQSAGLAVAPGLLAGALQHQVVLTLPAAVLAAAPKIALSGGALAAASASWLAKLVPAAVGAGIVACLVMMYLCWPKPLPPGSGPPKVAAVGEAVPGVNLYAVRTLRMVYRRADAGGDEEETLVDRDRGLFRFSQGGRTALFDNGQVAWSSAGGTITPRTPQFKPGELPREVVEAISSYGGAPARRLAGSGDDMVGYEVLSVPGQGTRVWVDATGRPRRIQTRTVGQTWERRIEYDVELGAQFEQALKTLGELGR